MPLRPCPSCGRETAGRYCESCGAAAGPAPCPHCGAETGGSAFCTHCGTALGRKRRGVAPGARVAWIAAGIAAVALVAVLGYSGGRAPAGAAPAAPANPPQLGAAPEIDLSTMTRREAADRLFNRVMRAVAVNDAAEVGNFLPMAISAYALVDSLGPDGAFHLSTLQRVNADFEGALRTAQSGLEEDGDHLLALSEASVAALALGDTALAQQYAAQLLDAWDRETARDLEDYQHHEDILPDIQTRAGRIAASR